MEIDTASMENSQNEIENSELHEEEAGESERSTEVASSASAAEAGSELSLFTGDASLVASTTSVASDFNEQTHEASAATDGCTVETEIAAATVIKSPGASTAVQKPVAISKPTTTTTAAKASPAGTKKVGQAPPKPATSPAAKQTATSPKMAGLAAQKGGAASPRAAASVKTVSANKQTVSNTSKPASANTSCAASAASSKIVTSTPKPSSHMIKSSLTKIADTSTIPAATGSSICSKEDKAPIFEANDDSFDVQVDDTMLNEIDADLLENNQGDEKAACSEADAESAPATETVSTSVVETQPAEETSSSAMEGESQEPVPAEGESGDKSKAEEETTVKDDKKPEEKKDEKDAKAVKRFVLFCLLPYTFSVGLLGNVFLFMNCESSKQSFA